MAFRYIFGPVASGRLGRSLGLDLVGGRICSLDCLYCEVGATAALTRERRPYVPAAVILDELAAWKRANQNLALDCVTLGGSGEPCLNSEMPAIIAGTRTLFPGTPVAVLTNSTLLGDKAVRDELLAVDVVLPSMDSLVEEEFQTLNRPAPGLTAASVAEALLAFRTEFTGRLYLEILLVAGINDTEANKGMLADFVSRLAPDRVDVVSMTRPGAYADARPVPPETLSAWWRTLGAHQAPAAKTKQGPGRTLDPEAAAEAVLKSLRRRPQTAPQLAQALDVSRVAVDSALATLQEEGHIEPVPEKDKAADPAAPGKAENTFYRVPEGGKYREQSA